VACIALEIAVLFSNVQSFVDLLALNIVGGALS
jgi:hypothetical protein